MPFNIECSAVMANISVRAKTKDGITSRLCKVKFRRDFDETIAQAIGGDAKKALVGLKSGGISSVEFPITGVRVSTTLTAESGDSAQIGAALGTKAVAKAAKQLQLEGADATEDNQPKVVLEFEFPFDEIVWMFVGRNCGAQARLKFDLIQLDIEERLTQAGKRKIEGAVGTGTGAVA